MYFSTRFASLALLALVTAARGAEVKFYNSRACNDPPSEDYRNVACNSCVDPAGDWFAAAVSGIGSGQRWTLHNEDKCTSKSQVAQAYGNGCGVAGHTAIRSVWVAC
ncbi:hypothetical protein PLICRDRAFT_694683 [Plicaturopsis crispa FD-325 SS-3]|nr:hypothetical protein PLICRDRAFT_694683 [Plicaturopsis crispa FD-325 SS-3]